MPTLALAVFIFLLRIVDVSLGTLRTIAVVKGQVRASMMFGFIEVLVWSLAITQVFIGQAPTVVLIGYAAGYAAGNAVGIYLERRFARRRVVFTILTSEIESVVQALREAEPSFVFRVTSESLHVHACRSFAGRIVRWVKEVDPGATCLVQDEI